METRCGSFPTLSVVVGVIGALFVSLSPGAAQANALAAYKIQPLVKTGDKVGDFTIGPATADGLWVTGLNDQGQVLLDAFSNATQIGLLAEYSHGALLPVALPGQDGPGGKWPSDIGPVIPMNMNQHGSVAFNLFNGGNTSIGIFRWDGDLRQTTLIARSGMPAVDGLTFTPGAFSGTAINNSNEVAFAHQVKDAAGKVLGQGLFFLGRDGVLHVVARPGQALPGGGAVSAAYVVSLNDAGAVGFDVQLTPNSAPRLYLWENGTITAISSNIAGGGQIGGWNDLVWVNNHDHTALVTAHRGSSGPFGLYRWSGGPLTPALEAGQALPGGGTFKDLDLLDDYLIASNDAGQYAFGATLTEGGFTRHGAYVLNPDGTLSLIVKEGMTTALGTITHLATGTLSGIGLNTQGQVALPVRIDNGAPEIVLLTPSTP
jgi:hypothetical protein